MKETTARKYLSTLNIQGRKENNLLMSKMKKIVSNSLEDGVKPKIVYNSAKLSQYFNVKDPVPQKYKSDLVYKCTCSQIDCNKLYISETKRHFEMYSIDDDECDKKYIYKYCR